MPEEEANVYHLSAFVQKCGQKNIKIISQIMALARTCSTEKHYLAEVSFFLLVREESSKKPLPSRIPLSYQLSSQALNLKSNYTQHCKAVSVY